MLTLGQYLQPAPDRLPVKRFLRPGQFDQLGRAARQLGFQHVASAPFVRSSYHAREMAEEAREAGEQGHLSGGPSTAEDPWR